MALGDIFSGYAQDFYVVPGLGGEAFDDPALSLFEDTGSNGSFAKSGQISWYSETVEWRFDSSLVAAFVSSNPTKPYVEFRLEWGVEDDGIGGYSVSLSTFLSVAGVDTGATIQITNDTATSNDVGTRKVAYIKVFGLNMPSNTILKDPSFGISAKFNVYNPQEDAPSVYVYEIQMITESSTGGGYAVAYDTDVNKYILFNETDNLGTIAYHANLSRNIRYYNFGDTNITFTQNGINTEYPITLKQPSPDTTQQIVSPNSYVSVDLGYYGANSNTSYNIPFRYECDAYNILDGAFYFNFAYSVAAQAAGKISVVYNLLNIVNGGNLALSSYPKDITNKVSVLLKNTGTSTLTINSVNISGDAVIAEDSVASNTVLPINSTANLKFYVINTSEGNKSATIAITSTDTTAPQFIIKVAYSILPQYNIVFKTGSSVSDATSVLQNGDTQVFGVIEKGRPYTKTFVLTNSGIYKSIIINSISVNNSNLSLKNLPSLPATLSKNNGSAVFFDISFATTDSGLKNGDLTIDYSEGA